MLQSYPILINGTEIPNPTEYAENSEVIENVNESEAGTDIVLVTRRDKLSVSLSFRCSSYLKRTLDGYRDAEPLTVKLYDTKTNAYKSRSMRIRNYKAGLVANSWRTPNTEGLYEVSFDLLEY